MQQHRRPTNHSLLSQAEKDLRIDRWLVRDCDRRQAIAEQRRIDRPQYVNREQGLRPSSERGAV